MARNISVRGVQDIVEDLCRLVFGVHFGVLLSWRGQREDEKGQQRLRVRRPLPDGRSNPAVILCDHLHEVTGASNDKNKHETSRSNAQAWRYALPELSSDPTQPL